MYWATLDWSDLKVKFEKLAVDTQRARSSR
jgi:hypothetical protein